MSSWNRITSKKGKAVNISMYWKNIGLTTTKMNKEDALFFYHLVLPICNPDKSGIKGYLRLSSYHQVLQYTNYYAYIELGLSGQQYGHSYDPVTIEELLHFDGVVVRDGVNGGSSGAIYRRWKEGKSYDHHIC